MSGDWWLMMMDEDDDDDDGDDDDDDEWAAIPSRKRISSRENIEKYCM